MHLPIQLSRIIYSTVLMIVIMGLPAPSTAASFDNQYYRRAFGALDAGHAEQAYNSAQHGADPVLNKVLRSYYMSEPGNDIGFSELANFISENPDWPNLRGILMIAEQKIPSGATNDQIINWFTAHSPLTLTGFYRYIDALDTTGRTKDVTRLIVSRWTDGSFTPDEMIAFHSRFERYLNTGVNENRLNHLLWKNEMGDVRRMYPYVDAAHKALAEARLALANQNSNAGMFVSHVPVDLQNDPGLLFERLRWYIRNHMDDAALDILQHAPDDRGNPEAWWEQSQVIIRRLMEQHDFKSAYQLANDHGQKEGKTLVQAEFMAGWLALRFLNQPRDALAHFQILYDNASTPISRARGAYWLGRTEETLGDKNAAQQSYETAASLNITYYGQLASTRLYTNPVMHVLTEPTIPEAFRQKFMSRDLIQATIKLHILGENDRARHFFNAAKEACFQRADFVLLTDVAYEMHRPDLAIETAKAAHQKNIVISSGGYPVLSKPIPHPPEPAFTHAIIRQESMFNTDATSPVGAQGLMQLMPSTARDVARKIGVRYKSSLLDDPDYNLRLGTNFIQNQLDMFDGSYILALAGYNAGPRHVREWIAIFGDPRSANTDPVDWVEEIPVSETRNYVQRIIESLQIYRARLNGGQAPLMIIKDLKR